MNYFAHVSFLVLITQSLMQMQYVELYVKNPEDPDTQERKKHYFIRKRGFNFLELITIPRSHELFKEDTLLGKHKDYIKETLNRRVSPLVDRTCPEEKSLRPKDRMNKAQVIGKFFEERKQYRSVGESPCGERTTFKCWTATPGAVAQDWYFRLGMILTVLPQMEHSGNLVTTTRQLLPLSLQQQQQRQQQQHRQGPVHQVRNNSPV